MIEMLGKKERKARKPHSCDYCCDEIKKGELYDWSKHVYDGRFYEFRTHKKCSFIAQELWDFIGPDDGMSEDNFQDGCCDFCQAFVCPECPKYDGEDSSCADDEGYCLDRIYGFLRENELCYERKKGCRDAWKCRPRGR